MVAFFLVFSNFKRVLFIVSHYTYKHDYYSFCLVLYYWLGLSCLIVYLYQLCILKQSVIFFIIYTNMIIKPFLMMIVYVL